MLPLCKYFEDLGGEPGSTCISGLIKFDRGFIKGTVDRGVVNSLLPYLAAVISGEWEKEETIERLETEAKE